MSFYRKKSSPPPRNRLGYSSRSSSSISLDRPHSKQQTPFISLSGMTEEKPRLGGPSTNGGRSKSARLWLIPPVILIIFILTKTLHPSHSTSSIRKQPHNYFVADGNQTIHQLNNPFEFCPSGGTTDALAAKYGASNLARSRIHAGSGIRAQRVLRRAMSGLPVTISVLGGSSKLSCRFILSLAHACCSICMSWCRRRPDIPDMLALAFLRVVEQRLPASRLRAHKRRNATNGQQLLCILPCAPYTGQH
jgi:hypothetical protein